MFIDELQATLGDEFNSSTTENGALGYRTSGKNLLDLNFAVASLRKADERRIIDLFIRAFLEDKVLAIKWLFYARDVRGGLGERRLFRVVMNYLATNEPGYVQAVISLISEYGRFDDLIALLDTDCAEDAIDVIKLQLTADKENMKANKPISLLGKWMPSENASSKETIRKARYLREKLGITAPKYRHMLSELRSYINVVECKMSAKQWGEIAYEAVPSRANLIYNCAFLRNDETRRREFLAKLEKGETKINSAVLFPHDIVHNYSSRSYGRSMKPYDAALEGMWKALPDTVKGNGNTIVVADGSGSMTTTIGGTQTTALEVANALAIYFAERSSGQFKDKYITFSSRPQLVDFSKCNTLRDKIMLALHYNEVADTNVEAVFDLILQTAVKNCMNQEDLPANILIISDMEFNSAIARPVDERLFTTITRKYEAYGYELPRLVFWNVNSRTGTIPVKENECGVALVSGFSPNIAKMVMSSKTDPYECLIEALNTPRYDPIEAVIRAFLRL